MFSSVERSGSVSSMRRTNVPPGCAGERPVVDGGTRSADMQLSRGGRRESDAYGFCGVSHGLPFFSDVTRLSGMRWTERVLIARFRAIRRVFASCVSLRFGSLGFRVTAMPNTTESIDKAAVVASHTAPIPIQNAWGYMQMSSES